MAQTPKSSRRQILSKEASDGFASYQAEQIAFMKNMARLKAERLEREGNFEPPLPEAKKPRKKR